MAGVLSISEGEVVRVLRQYKWCARMRSAVMALRHGVPPAWNWWRGACMHQAETRCASMQGREPGERGVVFRHGCGEEQGRHSGRTTRGGVHLRPGDWLLRTCCTMHRSPHAPACTARCGSMLNTLSMRLVCARMRGSKPATSASTATTCAICARRAAATPSARTAGRATCTTRSAAGPACSACAARCPTAAPWYRSSPNAFRSTPLIHHTALIYQGCNCHNACLEVTKCRACMPAEGCIRG